MHCYFCQRNIKEINFRDIRAISNFISASGKIKPRKKSGLCSYHQRKIAQAIKRARFMGLLPYVKE